MKNNIFSIEDKVWGTTQCIYCGPHSEFHLLKINKGGFCSEHTHKNKYNRFCIISGKLKITIFNDSFLKNEIILEKGNMLDIAPQTYHKFEALEDTVCLECYWTESIDSNDIERRTVGGII